MNESASTTISAAVRPSQVEFDFLVPYRKELLRPDEAARCLERSVDMVRDLVDTGKLEAHQQGSRDRVFLRITRRSVVAYLCETATYVPADIVPRLSQIVATLSPEQQADLLQRVGAPK